MEDIIKLHDKKFRIMIPAAKIDEAVAAVACRINEDYRDKPTPLFVGVLNGSFSGGCCRLGDRHTQSK